VTPLLNTVLPLIRFEITDQLLVQPGPCVCGSQYTRIGDVEGRLDESLRFPGGVVVPPIVARSPLGRQRNIAEYQVRQTRQGITVLLRTVGPVDMIGLRNDLAAALALAGVDAPEVAVHEVDELPRQDTGKLKRFIPLVQ
jgi:phenylacetate-CoA ligase